MSITSVSELELSLISFSGSDSTLTWQEGDKRNRRRQEGWGGGGGRLFEGGGFFKYFRLKEAIIQGRRLIEGRLLFEEIRYAVM